MSSDPLINWMRKNDVEVNRDNYLDLAYPEGLPEDWGPEYEEDLPPEIREMH